MPSRHVPGIDALAAGAERRAPARSRRVHAHSIGEARARQARERGCVARAALRLPHDSAVPREAVALERGEDVALGVRAARAARRRPRCAPASGRRRARASQ